MKLACLWLLGLSSTWFIVGCTDGAPGKRQEVGTETKASASTAGDGKEAKIQAALAELPPEDRKLAEAQRFCAVLTGHRLGSMGAPVKVMVTDQPVFLCCDGCEKKALADPEKTLAKVRELKDKAAGAATSK